MLSFEKARENTDLVRRNHRETKEKARRNNGESAKDDLPLTGQKKGNPGSGLLICGISPPDEQGPEERPIQIWSFFDDPAAAMEQATYLKNTPAVQSIPGCKTWP